MKLCEYCGYYPCQCGRKITEVDIDYAENIYEIEEPQLFKLEVNKCYTSI